MAVRAPHLDGACLRGPRADVGLMFRRDGRVTPRRNAQPVRRASVARAGRGPQPTLVLFVRHGLTPTTGKVLPGRSHGLHLADEGRAQAARVAERIATLNRPPAAVYASPLERTRETASPIARALGLRVRTERGLIECDVGDWTGATLKSVAKKPEWAAVQQWPSGFQFPGGESFADLQVRTASTVLRLAHRHPGETIVAVSHADPIKAVVVAAAGMPLDMFQRIVISPCSVSAVLYGPGGPRVLCINSTSELKELSPS
jgi:probable phosphomutase (TIGR03848 family)